eukprot:6179348-Pleurochrysis_carterae.AAC.1
MQRNGSQRQARVSEACPLSDFAVVALYDGEGTWALYLEFAERVSQAAPRLPQHYAGGKRDRSSLQCAGSGFASGQMECVSENIACELPCV